MSRGYGKIQRSVLCHLYINAELYGTGTLGSCFLAKHGPGWALSAAKLKADGLVVDSGPERLRRWHLTRLGFELYDAHGVPQAPGYERYWIDTTLDGAPETARIERERRAKGM